MLMMQRTKRPRTVSVPLAATVAAVAAIFCTSTAVVNAASAPGAHATVVPDGATICDSGTKLEGCVSRLALANALAAQCPPPALSARPLPRSKSCQPKAAPSRCHVSHLYKGGRGCRPCRCAHRRFLSDRSARNFKTNRKPLTL